MIPTYPLRQILADSVIDLSGKVRAHLCLPQDYGSSFNRLSPQGQAERISGSRSPRPTKSEQDNISEKLNNSCNSNTFPPQDNTANKGLNEKQQDTSINPYRLLGSCCGGRLVIMWLRSKHFRDPPHTFEASPCHKNIPVPGAGLRPPPISAANRAGSVSTAYSSSDDPSNLHPQASVPRPRSEISETDRVEDWVNSGERLGRIHFHLWYDFREMTLNLRIICANDLAAKDLSGTSDPYVKVMLLPDRKHKLLTNIKRKNLNPRWNETFAFEGFPYGKLTHRILYMQVLDYDRFSRDDPIGEICQPLCDVDLVRGETFWRTLQPCKGHTGKLGELLLSLCYQPTAESITLIVSEARELKSKDINGLSDPYVKIWLLQDGKRVEKRKTAIAQKTLNPVFNEMFMFHFPYERVRNTSLVVSVMDHDRMGRNEMIGQVILSSKSGPSEVKHWNEMFSKTRQRTERWHVLRNNN